MLITSSISDQILSESSLKRKARRWGKHLEPAKNLVFKYKKKSKKEIQKPILFIALNIISHKKAKEILGLGYDMLSKWVYTDKPLPYKRAKTIASAINYIFTPRELQQCPKRNQKRLS